MTIEAPLSKYKKQNLLIIIAVLIGVAGWLAYDGYKKQDFIDKHTVDGEPDSTLKFNRNAPPVMISFAVLLGVYFVAVKGKKVIAAENELTCGNVKVAYDAIEKINKTNFDSKGYFILTYTDGGQETELKLSDRTYDNLPAVLDYIVSKIS